MNKDSVRVPTALSVLHEHNYINVVLCYKVTFVSVCTQMCVSTLAYSFKVKKRPASSTFIKSGAQCRY